MKFSVSIQRLQNHKWTRIFAPFCDSKKTYIPTLLISAILLSLPLHAAQDTILLTDDKLLSGQIQGMQANFVILEIQDATGQATRRISPENIKALILSDTPNPEIIPTIQLLEQLVLRRAPLLGILQKQDELLLITLLDLYIESDRALEALSYAKLWHPKIQYTDHITRIEEQLILAATAADLPDEALVHAHNHIEKYKPTQTALAYHTIANAHLAAGNPEAALWTALTPIANAQTPPQPYLEKCYATAIDACLSLKDIRYARFLEIEMRSYKFPDYSQIQILNTISPKQPPPASLLVENLTFESLLKSNKQTQ